MSFSAWMTSFLPQAQQVMQWFRGFMTTFFTEVIGKNHLLYLVVVLAALGAAAYFIVELFYRATFSQGNYSANYKWTRDSAIGIMQDMYKQNRKKKKKKKSSGGGNSTFTYDGIAYSVDSDTGEVRGKRRVRSGKARHQSYYQSMETEYWRSVRDDEVRKANFDEVSFARDNEEAHRVANAKAERKRNARSKKLAAYSLTSEGQRTQAEFLGWLNENYMPMTEREIADSARRGLALHREYDRKKAKNPLNISADDDK